VLRLNKNSCFIVCLLLRKFTEFYTAFPHLHCLERKFFKILMNFLKRLYAKSN